MRRLILIGTFCWLVITGFVPAQDLPGRVNGANRLYNEGRFDEARKQYLEALKTNPELPELHFNLGDALYKSESFDQALESFRRSIDQAEPDLQGDAWYNLGNALFQQGDLEKSLEAYKQSLRIDPDDADTKHNLEYVLKQIQQQQQNQQSQSDDQEQQDQEDQEQQQDQQNQQDSEQQQPDEPQEEEQQQPSPNENESDEEQSSPQQQNSEQPQDEEQESPTPSERAERQMSPEEVQRILEALQEDPEQFLKRKLLKPSNVRVKKDW